MRIKCVTSFIFLFFHIPILRVQSLSDYAIYYQANESIYAIADLESEPMLIASDIPQTVAFSNSGHYVAYSDPEGVWLSPTETWVPKRVISTLPRESFALQWTPDDTRLMLRLAFWPENTEPTEQPLTYNLLTETTEPWIWGRCDQIAQHKLSKDFVLICEAYENMPTEPQIDAIALEWGGEYSPYDPEQYTSLLDGVLDFFPRPFDWGVTERRQNMVYMAENPDYRIESDDHSFWEIISLWNEGDDLEIDSPKEPDIELWFAVSNDRSMVAYTVFCGNPSDSCLQITDLDTGEIIWSYEDTVRIARPFDIAWYPDNQKVALLGANSDGHHIIQIFDIGTGDDALFDVENTSGVIAVS